MSDYWTADLTYRLGDEARTIEGRRGYRLDIDVCACDLGHNVWVDLGDYSVLAPVIGSTRDGWPVVADPTVIDLRAAS